MNEPSHIIEAEMAVLGACLLNSEAISEAVAVLGESGDMFCDEFHGQLFRAMIEMSSNEAPVDIVTLLPQASRFDESAVTRIMDISGSVPTSANVAQYACIVRECSQKRRLSELGRRLQLAANNGVAPAEIIADTQMELEKLTGDGAIRLPFADLADWREIANRPTQWVFDGTIPAKIVGCLAAPGGTGKSFLLLTLALSAVTGKTLLPAFVPTGPLRVLALFGEDVLEQVAKRLKSVTGVFENVLNRAEVDTAIKDRLRLVCADARPFTENVNGNVRASAFYHDVLSAAKTADLILIDPLSKFHGLVSENDNATASRFMTLVQGLAKAGGAAVLFSHHFNKSSVKERDSNRQAAPRGASAFIDESRWAAVLQVFDDALVKRFGIDPTDPGRFLELKIIKDNYAPRLVESIFFKRFEGGALRQIDIRDVRNRKIATEIARWLDDRGLVLAKRGIEENSKSGDCKELQKALPGLVGSPVGRDDRRAALRWGLANGVLKMVTLQPGSRGNNPQKLIEPGENYVPF